MKMPHLFLPLFLFIVPAVADAARVYRWVDSDGITHFGDLPPHHDARRMSVKPIPGGAVGESSTAGEGGGDGADAAVDGALPEDPGRAEYCRRYRADLKRYNEADVLVRTGADGHREELSEEQRSKLITDTGAAVERWCQPADKPVGE